MNPKQIGDWGETLVATWLRERGYRILAKGYRCRFGEIDLIAQKGEILCFVEVKLRSNLCYGEPREFVNLSKQRKIRITAEHYLASHHQEAFVRFDVAEVFCDTQYTRPTIQYHENAF